MGSKPDCIEMVQSGLPFNFDYEIICNDDTGLWGITIKNMKEKEFNLWLVLIMKLRDWLTGGGCSDKREIFK